MKFTISDAQVDLTKMIVQQGGQTRRLTRQSADILRLLHESEGEVVTKDMLITRVWGGRIVTDATLSTAIKEARRAVGDSGRSQKVIETVHGVGFRFARSTGADLVALDTSPEVPCILVLPFRNISADRDAQFLSEGTTDEIIASLSLFRDLRVLARATSDAIQAAKLDPGEIHRRYGVDFIIEGSLRRTEKRLRVSVQLVSTMSGAIIVTEQFDREATVSSLFDVQDQIARLCAGRLAGPHGPVVQQAALAARTQAPYSTWTMFRLVAEFRLYYRTYEPGLHARLRDELPVALEQQPEAADGWSAYSVLLLEEYRYHVNERSGVDALQAARDAAERAVTVDPRNAFAQTAHAMCLLYSMDINGFEQAASNALRLNPNNPDVLSEIGHCYAFLGRLDDGIDLLDRAMDISPEHPGWYHFAKCWRYARFGLFDAALLELQKVPMPGFYWYHAQLVWFLSATGDTDGAQAEAATLREEFPEFEALAHAELTMWGENSDLIESVLHHLQKAGLEIIAAPCA